MIYGRLLLMFLKLLICKPRLKSKDTFITSVFVIPQFAACAWIHALEKLSRTCTSHIQQTIAVLCGAL